MSVSSVYGQDSPAQVDDHTYDEIVAQAEESFQAGSYDEAISLLERAYGMRKNSNILYNIARIYEQKGDLEGALGYYDRFIVAPNVDLNYRREALDRSKTLREILDARKPREEPEVKTVVVDQDPRPVTEPEQSGWRTAGVVMAVVGGASVIGGGVFGVLALSEDDTRASATDIATARDSADRADLYAAVADGMIIGGAVVGITGLTIALLSGNDSDSKTAVAPMIIPGGAGATWSVKF